MKLDAEWRERMMVILLDVIGDKASYTQDEVLRAMWEVWGDGCGVGASNQAYGDAYH